jgi:hypothetical protein
MREPRRDHYVRPTTGKDARQVLDQATQALRVRRGFGPADDPGVALHLLASLIVEAQSRLPAAVTEARNQGCSWAQIADLPSVTRATVWQRYADRSSPNGTTTPHQHNRKQVTTTTTTHGHRNQRHRGSIFNR